MSLIDDLRGVENFATSHQPVVSELGPIVGALIAYVEHGDELLEAARADIKAREAGEPSNRVNELLSPTPAPPEPEAPPASAPLSTAPDDRDAEIASLRQQLATLQAQEGRTTVTSEPLGDPASPAPDAPLGAPASPPPDVPPGPAPPTPDVPPPGSPA